MLFPLQVQFFSALQLCLKLATRLIPFRVPRTFTGPGSALELCDAIAATGAAKVLLVTDATMVQIGLVQPLQDRLTALGLSVVTYDGVKPDPTIAQIEAGVDLYKREGCTAVLAVGGGSSIDAAKVIAARVRNPHGIRWMAGLFRLLRSPAPLYAVPTTAGTGSEVTIAAIVSDPENVRKFAIMDFRLVPQMAALDGSLMAGLPPGVTAATGMDALTHAVEAYLSRNQTAATDRDALDAVRLIMEHLPKVMADGTNLESRSQMALASYKAGMAFTTAGVGYVHAIAHNFGARYHVPHGLANAIILPYVLDDVKAVRTERLATLAKVSGLAPDAEQNAAILADRFIAHVRDLNVQLGIPTVVERLRAGDISTIAANACAEAAWYYAVPRYLDRAACERLIARMLPGEGAGVA